MKTTISEELLEYARKFDADFNTICQQGITDVSSITSIPDDTNLEIVSSDAPLLNWVRKEENAIKIRFCPLNLESIVRKVQTDGRSTEVKDNLGRDLRCRHVIGHEFYQGLTSKTPLFEHLTHNIFGKSFETDTMTEEGKIHATQLTCSDMKADRDLVKIKEQAIGFLNVHRQYYELDKILIDYRLKIIRTNDKLIVNMPPMKIGELLLATARRATTAIEIRNYHKNNFAFLADYRVQFFRFIDRFGKIGRENGLNIYNELLKTEPNWRSLNKELNNLISKMKFDN